MATYAELVAFRDGDASSPLRNKIRFAVAVKAQAIAVDSDASPENRAWAIEALRAPEQYEVLALNYLLAQNRAANILLIAAIGSQNTQETDDAVQGAVDALVDELLGA
jgi:hypothetical protein